MKIESYQQLEVWKKAMSLVTEVYQQTQTYPKEEIYALAIQIRRSAISIPANIAEGWGRKNTKEYVQFLRISRGSLLELETHLIISANLNYLSQQSLESLSQKIQEISKMLNAMIKKLSGIKQC